MYLYQQVMIHRQQKKKKQAPITPLSRSAVLFPRLIGIDASISIWCILILCMPYQICPTNALGSAKINRNRKGKGKGEGGWYTRGHMTTQGFQ